MRSAFSALVVTVAACMVFLAACFNKGQSGPSYDGGYPDVLFDDVNLPDAGKARYSVGGTVDGLVGTGLVLEAVTVGNYSEDVSVSPVTGGGAVAFTFQTRVPTGTPYTIEIKTQPTNPTQKCEVVVGTGTVPRGNIANIVVNCSTTSFIVGGTASGLEGTTLFLKDNGGDVLKVIANGPFAFQTPVPSGQTYTVAISANPTFPAETCTVSQGTGTITNANVMSVVVTCIPNDYNVGGRVVGLVGTGLILTDNASDNVAVSPNAMGAAVGFTFSTPVTSGSPYVVTISSQPSNPPQVCSVAAASGTVGSGDIGDVLVNCAANSFTVTGTVDNLAGIGLVLNTSAGPLPINSNGSFAVPLAFSDMQSYSVSVAIQPSNPSQACGVTGGTGNIQGASVTDVVVDCSTTTYTVGGQVQNLPAGSNLVLTNEGMDDLIVTGSGTFSFATPVASGTPYSVAVKTQPSGSTCSVSANGAGIVAGANVVNVDVECSLIVSAGSGDFCTDVETDRDNCSGCGTVCPGGEVCQGSECVCVGGVLCGAFPNPVVCVNPLTDNKNCGDFTPDSCGRACWTGATCQARTTSAGTFGACECPASAPTICRAPFHAGSITVHNSGITVDSIILGGSVRVDSIGLPDHCSALTDSNNCGACNNACPSGLVCQPVLVDGVIQQSCCPQGQTLCGNVCVDLTADPNCGACGVNCSQSELTCTNGSCCPPGQTLCGGVCVDETSDSQNCGGCSADNIAFNCSLSELTCTNGSCCPAGQEVCGGSCVDPATYASDSNNCGSCGNACSDVQECSNGVCCSGGLTGCDGSCIDPSSDPQNCSACGAACPTPDDPNAVATCSGDECGTACADGNAVLCSGLCTELLTDPNNCGSCGFSCSAPPNGFPACSGGECGYGCNSPFHLCSGACVDFSSDPNNCGGCDTICAAPPSNGTPLCAGSCTYSCTGSLTACPGTGCIDTTSDANNCGGCGHICPNEMACTNGSCCPSGQTLCTISDVQTCIPTDSDNQHCGGCAIVCPAGTTCAGGSCCRPGQRLCGNTCVDLASDPNNCGYCGTECPAGGACVSGSCCADTQTLCGPHRHIVDP